MRGKESAFASCRPGSDVLASIDVAAAIADEELMNTDVKHMLVAFFLNWTCWSNP
jgi:hypothetical protein